MITRIYILISFLLVPFLLAAQSINISEGEVFDGEPFMLVNPQNQQHIIVVWMGFDGLELVKIKERVSFNGGNTWSDIIEFSHIISGFTSADPSMDFDSDGNIFLCFIDYNLSGAAGSTIIYKSIDGGLTWNAPVEVINVFADGSELPVDRPWMVIDKSGTASDGNIYVTTKPAPWIPFPNRNYFIASTDGGASFNPWRNIDTMGWRIGSFIQAPMASPAVSKNGIFYSIYPAWELTENILPRFILASSENAGGTFNYTEVFESPPADLNKDTSAKLGYHLIPDPSDVNHLAFLCILQSLGDADIFLLESFDAGNNWSSLIRINDDAINNGTMQDLVWADFDLDGDLFVSWRDRRNAIDTGFAVSSQMYGAIRWKDSLNFSHNFPISDVEVDFDDVLYGNGNDFMCNAMVNDTIYAVWGDTRDGKLNIWFNKLSAQTFSGTGIQQIVSESRDAFLLYPNPANNVLQIEGENINRISIFDIAGKIVFNQQYSNTNNITLNIADFKSGIYSITLQQNENTTSQKFVNQ